MIANRELNSVQEAPETAAVRSALERLRDAATVKSKNLRSVFRKMDENHDGA
jgi:hypothetical protein